MTIRALSRNRNFLLLWFAQFLSLSSSRTYVIALLWWLASRFTHEQGQGLIMSLIMITGALPGIFFLSQIGKVVDRSRPRMLLIACAAATTLLYALLAALLLKDWLNVPLLLLFGFALACGQCLVEPMIFRVVPVIVSKANLDRGVSIMYSSSSISGIAGAGAGALLIAEFGFSGVLLACTVSCAAGVVLLALLAPIRGELRDRRQSRRRGADLSGFAVLKPYPVITRILVSFGLLNFFSVPYAILLPTFVKSRLHEGAASLGWLEFAIALGTVAGTLLGKQVPAPRNTIRTGAYCHILFALSVFCLTFSQGLIAALAAFFVSGFVGGLSNVKFLFYFHRVIPPAMKGRFFATLQGVVTFAFPLGYVCFGVLVDRVPVASLFALQAAGTALIAFYLFRLSRRETELRPT